MADKTIVTLETILSESSKANMEDKASTNSLSKMTHQSPEEIIKQNIFSPSYELLSSPPPPLKTLFKTIQGEDWLPCGIIGFLGAAGGTGKTDILLQMGASLATGYDFFHCRPSKIGKSLLIFSEEEQSELVRRMNFVINSFKLSLYIRSNPSFGDYTDFSPDSLTFADESFRNLSENLSKNLFLLPMIGEDTSLQKKGSTFQNPNPSIESEETDFFKTLLELNEKEKFDLIVLDPANMFFGPDTEMDSQAATRFMKIVTKLTMTGTTVLISHHTTKSSIGTKTDQGSLRGSGALISAARWVCNLENWVPSGGNRMDQDRDEKHEELLNRYKLPKTNEVLSIVISKANNVKSGPSTRRSITRWKDRSITLCPGDKDKELVRVKQISKKGKKLEENFDVKPAIPVRQIDIFGIQ